MNIDTTQRPAGSTAPRLHGSTAPRLHGSTAPRLHGSNRRGGAERAGFAIQKSHTVLRDGFVVPRFMAGDDGTLLPVLTGNAALLGWGWQGNGAFLDMLELQVDRADGKGWVMLAFDTTPNYTDTHPLPATLTKWKYRAIYRVDDAQTGVWSNTVEVTVGG